ncbi:MAG: hypothetical protein ACREQF_05785, partial [Candidatus Binataceae bacterium]
AKHQPLEILHSLCADSSAAAGATNAHVPEHFAKVLDLSSAQLSDIERIAADACAVMRRTHESILQVLTPEQRTRVRELHGGGHEAGGMHAFFKKLHGGD